MKKLAQRIKSKLTGLRQRRAERRRGIVVPEDYRPSLKEPFMNSRQLEYFRRKLLAWREDIMNGTKSTLSRLKTDKLTTPDPFDRAQAEMDRTIELRARDRQRKLVNKIDAALKRIHEGTYGYCEETGEPIALKRLEARPVATLSIEAQIKHERAERIYNHDHHDHGGQPA